MSIKYFYNFCLTAFDDTELEGDILSAVRKGYFASFEKIRDKITYDSEGDPLLYDYCIEKGKPLKWTVKTHSGDLLQEVQNADDGRYYLCFYRDQSLYKRMMFSKLHTLLKVEYINEIGVVYALLEPRKLRGGLCLLYRGRDILDTVLYAMPDVDDERVLSALYESFTDYTASASTNEGIVWFLTSDQMVLFRKAAEEISEDLIPDEESFVGDETPLFDKINPKDFNIKRNLSASLDITDAKTFGADTADEASEDEELLSPEAPDAEELISLEASNEDEEIISLEEQDKKSSDEASDEDEAETAPKPDKLIMADGAFYSYYGELDGNDNRHGYGRTVTDLGITAYEGMYRNDKRSGKGAYFYKDGTLCYSGDWSQNVRHGVGVGVSSKDGSMHMGRWRYNKPEGNGVRMSADGEIKFVCKELSDGETVLMNYQDDDTVVISKYDKDGNKISEKEISLTDL